jgi:hypothetical protein
MASPEREWEVIRSLPQAIPLINLLPLSPMIFVSLFHNAAISEDSNNKKEAHALA